MNGQIFSLELFECNELGYILNPKEINGPDFPGETFRILKEKEEKKFSEYRTRKLVIEAWDALRQQKIR